MNKIQLEGTEIKKPVNAAITVVFVIILLIIVFCIAAMIAKAIFAPFIQYFI